MKFTIYFKLSSISFIYYFLLEFFKMSEKQKQIREYMAKHINVFLEPLTYDIVKKRPSNPALFAMNWLKDYTQKNKWESNEVGSDSENDDIEELPFDNNKLIKKKQQGKTRSRMGISEEVFGSFNKKQLFVPKTIQKSEESKLLIMSLIRNSILFHSLDSKREAVVIDAMDQKAFQAGKTLIKQGDAGDCLFIVKDGQFDCFKNINGQETYLKTYKYGEAFGELSLMYNAPRAATIIAKTDGTLFILDRQTFSHIVKEAANKKRQLYMKVISQIEIFENLGENQKQQFCDVLKQQKYESGSYVLQQGEKGDRFYIVIEGKLVAEKKEEGDEFPKIVYRYQEGDYFGELALIHDGNRQASIKTLTSVRLASVGRQSFKRTLGSLQDILRRNEQKYRILQAQISV